MPEGFNWKTSFCRRCGSRRRRIGNRFGGSLAVDCAECFRLVGWLDPENPLPLPLDLAKKVPCNYGLKHYGEPLGSVPREYVQWIYDNGEKLPFMLKLALETLKEQGVIE